MRKSEPNGNYRFSPFDCTVPLYLIFNDTRPITYPVLIHTLYLKIIGEIFVHGFDVVFVGAVNYEAAVFLSAVAVVKIVKKALVTRLMPNLALLRFLSAIRTVVSFTK